MVRLSVVGDFSMSEQISKRERILDESNKTLSYFILKVDSKSTDVKITIDDFIYHITSISGMYTDGLTRSSKWRPWLLTYDTTYDIYVILFEAQEPISFEKFTVDVTPPSGTTVTSYYEAGFLDGVPGGISVDMTETNNLLREILQALINLMVGQGGKL